MNTGIDRFSWRGEPIRDIHQWAQERGERMVRYRATTRTPWGPEIYEGEMPQSFWETLAWTHNTSYEELK